MADSWCVSLTPASHGDYPLKAQPPGAGRRPPGRLPPRPGQRGLAPAPSREPISAAGALPGLFNQRERHAGRRAIGGQSV